MLPCVLALTRCLFLLGSMKVADLRTALSRLGEDTKGRKAELAERLSRALVEMSGDADASHDAGLLEELSVAE